MSTSTAGWAPASVSWIEPLPVPPAPPSRPVGAMVPSRTFTLPSVSSVSASADTKMVAALDAPAPPLKVTVGGLAARS